MQPRYNQWRRHACSCGCFAIWHHAIGQEHIQRKLCGSKKKKHREEQKQDCKRETKTNEKITNLS